MQLPFNEQQFFDLFGTYNVRTWPVIVALWLATLWYSGRLFRGRADSIALSALAAFHWAWSGLVYHLLFFTTINPAAWVFAAIFVLQAVAFVWFGVIRRSLRFEVEPKVTVRRVISLVFIAYSLAYPVLVIWSGQQAPRAPLFAVPCPTTVFTAGVLLAADRLPIPILIVPTLWALLGGTAAIAFGVKPDFTLFAAALSLMGYGAWASSFRAIPA